MGYARNDASVTSGPSTTTHEFTSGGATHSEQTVEATSSLPPESLSSSTESDGVASSPLDSDASTSSSTNFPAEATSEVAGECDEEGGTRPCSEAQMLGNCAVGTQTCKEGAWTECSITPGDADTCEPGDDADCDGSPNGGCPCVSGEELTCGPDEIGTCKSGVSTCANGAYSACVGAVYQKARDCRSALDNDCDGNPDNTLDSVCQCAPGAVEACNTHAGKDGNGPCRAGSRTCQAAADGSSSFWTACSGDIGPAASDSCLAMDDSNCNGQWNDGCECLSGQTTTCASQHDSKGVCGVRMITCSTSGAWPAESTCDSAASSEICTGNLDEDCDGQVNEADACPCSAAPCQNGGTCSASGEAYSCNCGGTGYTGTNCELPWATVVDLPAGTSECLVKGISSDGSTIGATCKASFDRAMYWTASGGWKYLTLPAGYNRSFMAGMSGSGQIFAATVYATNDSRSVMRWSSPTATGVALSGTNTQANALSADGTKIVGSGSGGSLLVWTNTNAPTTYTAPQGTSGLVLGAISGNASVVFGAQSSDAFYRWTASNSSQKIDAPNASIVNVAAANTDGTVVVGTGWILPAPTDVGWVYKNGTLNWLEKGPLPNCQAKSTNATATRIGGVCGTPVTPVLWLDNAPTTVEDFLDERDA